MAAAAKHPPGSSPDGKRRREAEKRLRARGASARGPADAMDRRNRDDLIHELEARQVELEMQNEELQKAQAAVQEVSDKYRCLFENMLNGVAYCRMLFRDGRPEDFVYLGVNGVFEALTGLKNVVGKRVSELIPGMRQSDPELFETYGRVARSGAPERFERYVHGLGMWFAISVFSPAEDEFVAVFDVITARKQAEAALLVSEARYRGLFQGSPTALREEDYSQVKERLDRLRAAGVTDFRQYFENHPEAVRACVAKVKILDLNQAALDLHQAASKEELLAGLQSIFLEESYDTFREMLVAISGGATTLHCDTVVRTLRGEKRHILLGWTAAPQCERTLAKVYITQVDITERKRLQAELALRERHLQSFFGSATAGLALLDQNLRYVQINDVLAKMNGLPASEHLGKTVREVVPRIAPLAEPLLQQVLATGQPVANVEVAGETPSQPGVQRSWMESFFPVAGADGSVAGVGAIAVETTERKRAESRIEHLNEVLRAVRDIGALIVRERNEKTLLAEACNTLLRTRGYRLVWVGGIVPDSKRVVPLASAGPAADYLDGAAITWDESATGRGPIGTALRERRTTVCQDAAADPLFLLWREPALARGYRSVAGVPMIYGQRLFGVIAVYADRPAAFDEEELRLLGELADDLAFALQSIEAERHRMQAEATLRESEERFRAAIESSPAAIALIDLDGRLLMANQQAALLTGFRDAAELLASGIRGFDLLIPADRQRAQAELETLWEKRVVRGAEFQILRRDGVLVPVEANASLQTDAHGAPIAALLITRDISDRKHTEDTLRQAKQAAEAANRAKSEFLANMSHEIRTPMTAILGFSDLLLAQDLPHHQQRKFLHGIERNGKALMELIGDILDLARIEADKLTFEKVDYSLPQAVDDVLQVVRLKAQEKGLSLDVDYRFPLPGRICTDPVRLRQILVNLLGNAIKFTDRGGVRLAVACLPGKGSARLQFAVSDTGIGIPADKLGDLFQPFTQVDASSTRRYGGTGLGLAISQRLAKALGGKVEVASEPGRGSTFTLTIDAGSLRGVPMLRSLPAAERVAEPPAAPEQAPPLRGRVLVVEDVPAVALVISYILQNMHLEVEIAGNGRVACEMAEKSRAEGRPYDLILMDIQMPERNGYEATRWLRRHGWNGPIVALTAHVLAGDREACLAAGCDDYLAKPIAAGSLRRVLERHLAARALLPPAAASQGTVPLAPPEGDSPIFADTKIGTVPQPVGSGFLDSETAARLLAAYLGELPSWGTRVENAVREQDRQGLMELAHQLKGTAGVYGLAPISQAARLVHQLAKEEEDWERLRPAAAELVALCNQASPPRSAAANTGYSRLD
jgi:PAS domain S-box-containing protein